jgi:hypothetical protein
MCRKWTAAVGVLFLLPALCVGQTPEIIGEIKIDHAARRAAARKIRQALRQRVTMKPIPEKVRLKDALEYVGTRWNLTILIDVSSFKADGAGDIEGREVFIRGGRAVTKSKILADLLDQAGATYLIPSDHIIVVPDPGWL